MGLGEDEDKESEAAAELERMKVDKEFRRMQQQRKKKKRENWSMLKKKLSNREFMINTSSQIIARRVKAEPTQVHKKQKISHSLK